MRATARAGAGARDGAASVPPDASSPLAGGWPGLRSWPRRAFAEKPRLCAGQSKCAGHSGGPGAFSKRRARKLPSGSALIGNDDNILQHLRVRRVVTIYMSGGVNLTCTAARFQHATSGPCGHIDELRIGRWANECEFCAVHGTYTAGGLGKRVPPRCLSTLQNCLDRVLGVTHIP